MIVPAKHPWARRRTIAPDELAAADICCCSTSATAFATRCSTRATSSRGRRPQGKEGNSLETIRNMVASGMGISVLPATALTPKYAMPLVKAIDFAPPPPSRRIVLASRDAFPRRAALAALAAAIPKLALPIEAGA